MDWQSAGCTCLSRVLTQTTQLETLELCNNDIGPKGAKMLVSALELRRRSDRAPPVHHPGNKMLRLDMGCAYSRRASLGSVLRS